LDIAFAKRDMRIQPARKRDKSRTEIDALRGKTCIVEKPGERPRAAAQIHDAGRRREPRAVLERTDDLAARRVSEDVIVPLLPVLVEKLDFSSFFLSPCSNVDHADASLPSSSGARASHGCAAWYEYNAHGPRRMIGPGRRPSRLGASRRAPQGDGL